MRLSGDRHFKIYFIIYKKVRERNLDKKVLEKEKLLKIMLIST